LFLPKPNTDSKNLATENYSAPLNQPQKETQTARQSSTRRSCGAANLKFDVEPETVRLRDAPAGAKARVWHRGFRQEVPSATQDGKRSRSAWGLDARDRVNRGRFLSFLFPALLASITWAPIGNAILKCSLRRLRVRFLRGGRQDLLLSSANSPRKRRHGR